MYISLTNGRTIIHNVFSGLNVTTQFEKGKRTKQYRDLTFRDTIMM